MPELKHLSPPALTPPQLPYLSFLHSQSASLLLHLVDLTCHADIYQMLLPHPIPHFSSHPISIIIILYTFLSLPPFAHPPP
ncbi:hypothetical protein BGS_1422 [Beggiatoa sp. SS]|nr:hypothetical protein BGS_1422 [Beggiatoa sp. SS]